MRVAIKSEQFYRNRLEIRVRLLVVSSAMFTSVTLYTEWPSFTSWVTGSFSVYILSVRASYYIVIRVHVHCLFCNTVLHVRKPAYFVFAFVQSCCLFECEHEAGDGDSGFFRNVCSRYHTTCCHHLFIRKVSGQRACFLRYFHNYFTLLRLTESFPFIAFISQKIELFLLAYWTCMFGYSSWCW